MVTTARTLFLLLLLIASSAPALAQADADGDGVEDALDLCPLEDASGFDANGDGCLDDPLSARHIEYWADEDLPLRYVVHEDGAPNVTDGSDFASIDAALAAWAAVPDTRISVVSDGTTAQGVADAMDGIHQVTFVDDEFDFGAGVLAVGITTSFTTPTEFNGRTVRPGQIVDADMIFNPLKTFRTATAGATGSFIQAVATHEAGHWFGLAHSAVPTSTMFYVLPSGDNASSLETEDANALFRAYPDATALADATRLSGSVVTGDTAAPVPGAAVFVADAVTGEEVACDYTLPDGTFTFVGIAPGDYTVRIHPLDGTSGIGFLRPAYVNQLVLDNNNPLFVPEFWSTTETNADDPTAKAVVTLTASQVVAGIDLITNIDAVPPVVLEATPDDADSGVRIDAAVLVVFDEAIDANTIQGNFKVTDGGGAFVNGSAAILEDDRVLAFTPNRTLAFQTNYQIELGAGLSDRFGNALGTPQIFSFDTEPQPSSVVLSSLQPNKGIPGGTVLVSGEGFDALAGTQVLFDGLVATLQFVRSNLILAEVPPNIEVGNFQVTVRVDGETSNPLNFSTLSTEEIARGTDVGVVGLDGSPRDLTLQPDGSRIFVGTSAGVSSVVVDPGLPGYLVADVVPALDKDVDAVSSTPDGRRVYAASRTAGELYWIDSNSSSPNFGENLATLPIDGEPLGIQVDPSGLRLFMTTTAGEIQVWDTNLASETVNRQVGVIRPEEPGSFTRALAFDPTGRLLLAPSATGDLLIFDAVERTQLAALPIGFDPQDITVDPAGALAYVSDGGGQFSVIALGDLALATENGTAPTTPPFKVQDVTLAGSPRGLSVTPAASYAYVANRELDRVDVVDLEPTNPTFRSVIASIPTGADPIASAVSLEGDYVFSVVEGSDQIQVTAIGFGPVIESVNPRFVIPGARVAIRGVNFVDQGQCQSVCPPGTVDDIYFGDTVIDRSSYIPTGTGFIAAKTPLDFQGGPVRVRVLGGGPPNAPDPFSNAVNLTLIDVPVRGTLDGMRFGTSLNDVDAFQFRGGLSNEVVASPLGDVVLFGGYDARVFIMDSRRGSPDYGRILRTVSLNGLGQVVGLAITPDGKTGFVSTNDQDQGGKVEYFDASPTSPTFGDVLGEVVFGGPFLPDFSGVEAGDLLMHPTGEYLFLRDDLDTVGRTFVIADLTDRFTVPTVAEESYFNSISDGSVSVLSLGFQPGADNFYAVLSNRRISSVVGNNLSAGFGDEWQFLDFTRAEIYGGTLQPLAVGFHPSGDFAIALCRDVGPVGNHSLVRIDATGNGGRDLAPLGTPMVIATDTPSVLNGARIRVLPTGDRAIVDIPQVGLHYVDITDENDYSTINVIPRTSSEPAGLDVAPDGSGAYVIEDDPGPNSLDAAVYDFSGATDVAVISGNNQRGVIGEKLPAPIRVQVTQGGDAGDVPSVGTPVKFRLISGDPGLPNGSDIQVLTTDENGIIELEWTLGFEIDPPGDTDPSNVMQILVGNFQATAYAFGSEDPESVPLSFVQIKPEDGAGAVSSTTSVQAIFSRALNAASATPQAYFVRPDALATPIPAVIGLADDGRRLSLTPVQPLDFDTAYAIEITDGLLDASGNPLSNPTITQFTTSSPPPLKLSSVSPPSAALGIELVLAGAGFDPNPAGQTVLFNDIAVVPVDASVDFLRVKVPLGATSGQIRVQRGADVTEAKAFTVLTPTTAPLDQVVAQSRNGSATRAVAVTPDGTIAYTLSPDGNVVIPIRMADYTALPGIPVGNKPLSLDIHPDGKIAYVANFESDNVSVLDIDPASPTYNRVVETIQVGKNPIDLQVSPVGDRLYVANAGDDFLSVVDSDLSSATFNTVVSNARSGSSTRAVSVSPDGTVLYLGTDVGYIIVESANPETVVASAGGKSATRSLSVTPDGTLLIVLATNGSVDIHDVNPESATFNNVVASAGGKSSTRAFSVSPDGTLLYLVRADSDEILVFSLNVVGSVSKTGGTPVPTVVELIPLDPILTGPDPSLIAFDPSGSGVALVATAGDETITFLSTGGAALEAVVDVDNSSDDGPYFGRWIFASIELPAGSDPHTIDLATVVLETAGGNIPAQPDGWSFQDADGNGREELVVRFDRIPFQDLMAQGTAVEVTVSGEAGGVPFSGQDALQTQRPGLLSPVPGDTFVEEGFYTVLWENPPGVTPDEVDIIISADDGETWAFLHNGIANNGFAIWTAPKEASDDYRILVRLFVGGVEIGAALSGRFSVVEKPVSVLMGQVETTVQEGEGVLRWTTPGASKAGDAGFLGFHVYRGEIDGPATERLTTQPVTGQADAYEFRDTTIRGNRSYAYTLEEARAEGPGFRHGPYKLSFVVGSSLEQNYPNSFNPRTTIRFSIATSGPVRLAVYDLAGRRVRELVNGELAADNYSIPWDGTDGRGSSVASGTYLYRLEAPGFVATRKMVLVR